MGSTPPDTEPVNRFGYRCTEDGCEYFYYIPIEEQEGWIAVGWQIVSPLGEYSVLGKWGGEGEPVKPAHPRAVAG